MNNQKQKSPIIERLQYAALTAYYFCLAYVNQGIANYLDRRLETKRRYWIAYGTFGSGVVPLGKVTLAKATRKVSRFGTVVFCDVEKAKIFYSEKRPY